MYLKKRLLIIDVMCSFRGYQIRWAITYRKVNKRIDSTVPKSIFVSEVELIPLLGKLIKCYPESISRCSNDCHTFQQAIVMILGTARVSKEWNN